MKTKNYQVFQDSGHAWCKVRFSELLKLGIEKDISNYSYQKGDFVYLEEDCDLAVFVKALSKIGIKPYWKVSYTDKSSKIRSYNRYICFV